MRTRLLLTALLALIAAALFGQTGPSEHPILEYVNRPDKAYAWTKEGELALPGVGVGTRIQLTSQVWQGITWKHELDIIRPEKVRPGGIALLFVTGDRGDMEALQLLANIATAAEMPAAVLFDIPNQPLFDGKREDALISYTFMQFLATKDRSWPLLYPMTKSVVRAMDAIQELATRDWKSPLKGFVVSGASKRGWTTWFTGAVDRRVVGIAPMVYDNLNLGPQMAQQRQCYGTYSEQIDDYSTKGLPDVLATPEGKALADMVDPYALRDRLTMPKLIINGSNDRYWTLESANLYYNDLKGEKNILYAVNSGHGLDDRQRVLDTLGAFLRARAAGRGLPQVTWKFSERPTGLQLIITPPGKPVSARVFTAESATKDFRNAKWQDRELTLKGQTYSLELPRPRTGYAGLFGEVTYRDGERTYTVSTTPKMVGAR